MTEHGGLDAIMQADVDDKPGAMVGVEAGPSESDGKLNVVATASVNCGLHPSDPRCGGQIDDSLPSPTPTFIGARAQTPPYDPRQHYCGADGCQAFPGGSWGRGCYNHDNCYGTPGADKAKCDINLMQDIMDQCSKGETPSPICAVIAAWYYLGVNYGGNGVFNKAQRPGK